VASAWAERGGCGSGVVLPVCTYFVPAFPAKVISAKLFFLFFRSKTNYLKKVWGFWNALSSENATQ
jgi:hypothetical protein